jgi:hypothetical protein
MALAPTSVWQELATPAQREGLARLARERRWGLSLLLVGWLHLAAFLLCHYLTVARDYHGAAGYLAVWAGELAAAALVFRLCGGPRRPGPAPPLARLVFRVWLAYFALAFNLCALNGVRGHRLFELFPAVASLGSFAFLAMAFVVNRRFFGAVLVLFPAGLLMAANLTHCYLVFALAWWLVLNGVGLALLAAPRPGSTPPLAHPDGRTGLSDPQPAAGVGGPERCR